MRVQVRRGSAIVCTITNTAKQEPDDRVLSPVLECVVFNDGSPDVAVWGYRNSTAHPVTIRVGNRNRFTPAPQGRGQPTVFEPGRFVGVFSTPFEAESTNLVWSLSGRTATASSGSPRCTATVQLRKVVVPASDPGVFQLRLNGEVVATGGNGTTTEPITVGTGEGTVSETAVPGTSLADYDSSVECTRNGTVEVSVPGTKVDGAVARGRRRRLHVHESQEGSARAASAATSTSSWAATSTSAAPAARASTSASAPRAATSTSAPRASASSLRLRRGRRPRPRCSTSRSPRPPGRRRSSSAGGSRGR